MSLVGHDLEFGQFRMDTLGRRLYRGSEVVPLSGKTFDLLDYMARNAGRPLLKKELLEAVWPASFVEESNLSQNVFVLRKAMGLEGNGLIETLPGRGYCFNAVVTTPGAHAMTTVVETTETRLIYEEETEERISFWRSPVALGFAVAAVVSLGVAGWLGWQRYEDRVGGPPVQVVVADLDGSSGDAVLDRTLTNVLKIEMAQSPFVNVVSGGTVRRTLALMMHKPDDPVTGQVARDLCERTNSQAILHMAVARAGNRYLLTEEAMNCADGTTMATSQQDVARVDDLPRAITRNSVSIRHSLGESRRMIARFNQPLVPVSTGSIDALKDYSQAAYLGQRGRFAEALELLKQAIAIDPNFATAYNDAAVMCGNMSDTDGVRDYIQKAYDRREYATEPVRLFITAFYHQEVTGDLYEAIRNYKTWINLYPKQPQPYSGMAEADRQLGKSLEAITAQQRTLQLVPTYAVPYYGLAEAQMRTGDYANALATSRLAISRNMDSEPLRLTLLRLGHLMHDPALIAEQTAWRKQHPDSPLFLINEANFAQAEGRMKDAQELFNQAWDVYKRLGAQSTANRFRVGMAATWWDYSEPKLAREYLYSGTIDTEYNALLAQAELGAPEKTEAMVRDYLASHPQSTLWNQRYAPLLRGEIALLEHKPQDAVTLMEPSRQLDGASLDGYYLRGMAYMQANQLDRAESEFRALLAHPYIEPTAPSLPLAQLQLARVLKQQGNKASAEKAYNAFLTSWAHADPDQPLLLAAKNELDQLRRAQ